MVLGVLPLLPTSSSPTGVDADAMGIKTGRQHSMNIYDGQNSLFHVLLFWHGDSRNYYITGTERV
jgi:hypothetical protein